MDEHKYYIVDTLDYSEDKCKVVFIIGGMHIKEVCQCVMSTIYGMFKGSTIVQSKDIIEKKDGFQVTMPIQMIPEVVKELVTLNIGIYSVIPIK